MAARKTRSKKTKAAPAPAEVVKTPIVDPAPDPTPEPELEEEVTEVIPTPEPEFDIVFVPDDELDIVFIPDHNSAEEVAKRVARAKKVMEERRKDLLSDLNQTQYGRGRTQYRRRTRREEQ